MDCKKRDKCKKCEDDGMEQFEIFNSCEKLEYVEVEILLSVKSLKKDSNIAQVTNIKIFWFI